MGPLAMEAIGILESLHAANQQIARHITLLKLHSSSVPVRVSTDCQADLLHIARTRDADRSTRQLPKLGGEGIGGGEVRR